MHFPRLIRALFLALSACAVIGAGGGCTSDPQLDAYRTGLHQLDEPLYQAHLKLMSDAITAGIRTTSDQQVIQTGINEAEALYQQSVATEQTPIVGTPTTQPAATSIIAPAPTPAPTPAITPPTATTP